ncbi:pyridoxamine 5'-phosphate oxidase family protein [Actinokineospora fastidiosa]|uniref:Oxidoreductase n=1 Tax=Actinokineospora fastidiosa TaxID=1816 RepID=A0A918GSP0_9PSEU|nr:pyridoxamine 5'-phosphate oxidase family protein [Actinokineospora fastidiosa]GGS56882.1 oxidoreductase [Actinokineospora fastidiosa]
MHHPGEIELQRRVGMTRAWGSGRVGADIPPVAADFLAAQRLVVIGAADDDGAVWAGPLAGPPGFARASGSRTVVVDREPVDHDPLGALFATERDIGMLAIEPASRRRMRINGRARQSGGALVLHTEQVYANCPKYIQTRTVVDGDDPPATTVRTSTSLDADQRAWITAADTFFIATRAPGLGADCSHRGGGPGFVTVAGDRLTWPDYVGNSMFMTLGNLELDPRAGLLFLDWERGATLQLTGRARADWDGERAAAVPGAQRMVDFDVERVVQIAGLALPRWVFGAYSKFNPGNP